MMAFFAAPSFQDGSGSAVCACVGAAAEAEEP